jgi:hypothetical protein
MYLSIIKVKYITMGMNNSIQHHYSNISNEIKEKRLNLFYFIYLNAGRGWICLVWLFLRRIVSI